jgi:hypothetical protein
METAMAIRRIPKAFMDDHEDRDLPTPKVIKMTKQHYWIDTEDPATDELLSDAEFYADAMGPDAQPAGLANAARAVVRALRD